VTDQTKPRQFGKIARKNVFWSFLREAGDSLVMLPTSVVLARLLSPTEFGIAAVAYFFLSLGARLSQFGLQAALVRTKELRPEHASSVFAVNLGLGAFAWGVLTVSASAIAAFVRNEQAGEVIPVAALTFFISAFGTVPGALLARDVQRYRARVTCEWSGTIANVVVAILLAWNGFSFWSIVYGHLANDLARASARLYFARWRPSVRFSPQAFRELVSFGAGTYVKNLLDYAAGNIDNLIVGRVLGMSALGFYDKAFNLTSRMLSRINLAGPSASFRIFVMIHEEHERFRRAYRRVLLAVSLVGYPMLTGLIVMAPELISLLFGPRWMPSVLPFQVLCAAGMPRLLNTYASTATQAKGMIWSEVRRQVLVTVLLAAAVAIMCRWGIAGAATGVFLATAVTTVLMQQLVRRLTGLLWRDLMTPQVPAVVCSLGLALVMALARFVLGTYADPSSVTTLAVVVCVAAIYYVAFLLFSGFGEVRELVCETLDDFSPPAARRVRALTARKALPAATGR
jgi:O-antigen/teichoic acid export membrane protein